MDTIIRLLQALGPVADLAAAVWPYFMAAVFPILIGLGLTQVEKSIWRLVKRLRGYRPDEYVEAWILRALATVQCFVPAYILWPDVWPFLFACALAPWTIVIYQVAVGWAYSRWPDLEDWISANPGPHP